MNIFSNLVNGSVNYKKIVDDYMAKDRSVTASYGRNHINRPTQGYLGLLLLVAYPLPFSLLQFYLTEMFQICNQTFR